MDIVSDVALAGAVAQYGRAQGVIADVAQVIIDTFAENLRRQIAARETPAAAATATAAPTRLRLRSVRRPRPWRRRRRRLCPCSRC